jgi:hypothetical protein
MCDTASDPLRGTLLAHVHEVASEPPGWAADSSPDELEPARLAGYILRLWMTARPTGLRYTLEDP